MVLGVYGVEGCMRNLFRQILYQARAMLEEHTTLAYIFWYIGVMVIFPFTLAISVKVGLCFALFMVLYTVVLAAPR